ncbi:hypothetical protein D9M70_568590 [compost metagenome]
MKQMFGRSSRSCWSAATCLADFSCTAPRVSYFSTGKASPVNTAWLMNRSRDSIRRISAGIMSPAASRTMSPATRSLMGISRSSARMPRSSRRSTLAVVRTMALSPSAALAERCSCQKRIKPLASTMDRTMITPVRSVSSPSCKGSQKSVKKLIAVSVIST